MTVIQLVIHHKFNSNFKNKELQEHAHVKYYLVCKFRGKKRCLDV
jgi:hypothetical protein